MIFSYGEDGFIVRWNYNEPLKNQKICNHDGPVAMIIAINPTNTDDIWIISYGGKENGDALNIIITKDNLNNPSQQCF